jgi:hypothetical protein
MAARISNWRERLRACFRWQQRLLHVVGVPSAVGAVTAAATASALNPEVGLALGALTAGTGVLIAGYYVVAGFDRGLEALLTQESHGRERMAEQNDLSMVLATADPLLRTQLERCLDLYATTEAVFRDNVNDSVEDLLKSSLGDLEALKRRAVAMVKLHQRLTVVVQSSNAENLAQDVRRMDRELAQEKRSQVASVLTLIENSLREFKLGVELRKADATIGGSTAEHDVSELSARLIAAGQACDELVGGASSPEPVRRQRRRAT